MIEAVLFDCWGTLLQAPSLMRRGASVEIFHRSLSRDCVEIDFEAFSEAYEEEASRQHQAAELDYHELDYAQRIDSALQEIGFQHPRRRQIVQKAWEDYLAEWPRQSTPYDETQGLLASLRGRYKLGLITNFWDGPTAREVFQMFGFDEVFDSMVISGELGFRKPNPLLFRRALSELGVPPESAVMVGDTFLADVVGPKNLGIRAILIDADGNQRENHREADFVVRGVGEVGEALKVL
ncbi:MAG: HAD family hydrolase [Candidatus Bathyarchaeota archaeon]|nr:HAD family hydrolase [Candidatus Bathyarchaeota archaeon]MDH5792248.1 HAD family hydrolase [Candidatus Bathyarchaeota archaeon]